MKAYVHLRQYLTEYLIEGEKFPTKAVDQIKTHILCSKPSPKNHAIYDIMWKNMVQPERAKMKTLYGACVSHAGQIRL